MQLYLYILAVFVTGVLLAYALTPKRFRYLVLLAASIAANFVYNHFLGVFILVTSVSVYLCGLGISALEKKYSPALKVCGGGAEKTEKEAAAEEISRAGGGFDRQSRYPVHAQILKLFRRARSKTDRPFRKRAFRAFVFACTAAGDFVLYLAAIGYAIDVAAGNTRRNATPRKSRCSSASFPN